jgi:hypothetical protein
MFPGFALDEFEQYRAERASSNVYNRQRLVVKEKMLEILHAAHADARAARPDLEPGVGDHAPTLRNARCVVAQWGYLWRTPDERQLVQEVIEGSRGVAQLLAEPPPHERHAVLAAVLDTEGFALAVRVSARALVDAANLRALLAEESGRAALLAALHALPSPFAFALAGAAAVPAGEVGPAELETFLAAFALDGDTWFDVGRRLPKAEAAAAGSGLLAQAARDLVALLPVFGLAAWARTNDRVGFDALLRRVRLERSHEEEDHEREQRAFAERKAESRDAARERLERRFAERTPEMTRGGTREIALPPLPAWAPVGRRPRREEPAAEPAPTEAPGAAEAASGPGGTATVVGESRPGKPAESREAAHAVERAGRPSPGPARPAPAPRPSSARPEAHAAASETDDKGLAPGKLVRFREGPLRGRVGTLFELDPRGEARVMLGLFTTRVPVGHLIEVRRRDQGLRDP